MSERHLKFGGVGFKTKASASTINRFVNNLPSHKRDSLFEVAEELQTAGMIETTESITHKHNRGQGNPEVY